MSTPANDPVAPSQTATKIQSSDQDARANAAPSSTGKTDPLATDANNSSKLPGWIMDNITSSRSLRILARCWVATWANFVLMIPNSSLRVLGQAAFFCCMLTLMIPPSMPFFIFVLAFGIVTIGALTGWAWGCAAMAAATRARSQPLLASEIQRVKSSAASATNPEAYAIAAVFQGDFLDVRCTAVFGIFLMIGVYCVAVLQVKLPKLKIGTIFLLIVLDVMVSYGPLFPYARYSLGETFMIPIGCSLAVCLATQILVFPETLAYMWQLRFVALLQTTRDLGRLHYSALTDVSQLHDSHHTDLTQASSDLLEENLKAEDQAVQIATNLLAKIKTNRITLAEHVAEINGMSIFLGMEVYRSYLSARDMKLIFRKSRSVNLQFTLLNAFWRLVTHEAGLADRHTFDEGWDPSKTEAGYLVDGEHGAEALPSKERLQPIRLHETSTIHRVRQTVFASEAKQQVSMSRMLRILHHAVAPSLAAADDSIEAVQAYFEANLSWKQKRPIDQVLYQLHQTKTALDDARQSLLDERRLELLKPYADHFRALHPDLDLEQHFLQTKESIRAFRAGARPLHICLVYVSNVLDALDCVSELHGELLSIADRAGTKKRFWAPKHLGRLFGLLTSDKRGSTDGLDRLGQGDAEFEREEDLDKDFREDRAQTASSTDDAASRANLEGHMEGESDSDEENEPTRSSPSRSSPPIDEEKSSTSATDSAKKGSGRKKRTYKQRYYARDPDALPPTSVGHRIGRGVAATYYFVTGTTGIYALRMCIASFAVWITFVVPQSAGFAYKHRGIWALIMAQTSAALSGGELILTFALRIVSTLIGLLYGTVLWYISTGKGNGNPYGLAATCAVGFIPLVFLRVWAPKMLMLPAIMLSVSVVLIVGYSWVDTHLQVTASSGIGIDVAWRRTVLVMVGLTVAFLVMVFPRPVSSRLLLRKSMAKVTRQLNDLFIDVMETWIARNRLQMQQDERAGFENQIEAGDEKKQSRSDAVAKLWQEREPVLRARFMAISARVAMYPMQIRMAAMDFHIRGRWPVERYVEIATVHATIVESLGSIISSIRAFDGMPTVSEGATPPKSVPSEPNKSEMDWQQLMRLTTLLDPQYLSEICTMFDLLSKALRNGERLNHASLSLLENYFVYTQRSRNLDAFLRKKDAEKGGQTAIEGQDVVSWAVLRDPMYLRFTTARMAAITLAAELDKFKAIVQDLVGESSLRGFDMLKEEHDERMLRAAMHRYAE